MIKVNISYRNKKIVLETKCRVSILSDNSGIGKTYLLKVIKQALEASEYSPLKAEKDGKECKNVYLILEDTPIDIIREYILKNGFIIIDECDILFTDYPELIDSINKNKKADYMLIMRGLPKDLEVNTNSQLVFKNMYGNIMIEPFESRLKSFFCD